MSDASRSTGGGGEEGGSDDAGGGEEDQGRPGGQQHGGQSGEPSSSRQRSSMDRVWPEPFAEAVAFRVAAEAARDHGRLAAAPAVAALFQVSSTWRAVSYSELLWQNLTHEVWSSAIERQQQTWQEEYVHHHRTARNFHIGNAFHISVITHNAGDPPVACCRLALSDNHIAAGYIDGSVRLFEFPSTRQVATYGSHLGRDLLGPLSRSIAGLILDNRQSRLVFASQDGDIHVASTRDYNHGMRCARAGNLVEDGTLVDFSGCRRWWVGLFAGVPGRSIQVWDGGTEELIYVGGSLTDSESVLGWRMLTEVSGPVGRVRVTDTEGSTLVACTASRIQTMDLYENMDVLAERQFSRVVIVESVDSCNGRVLEVDSRGLAKVRHPRTLEQMCRFSTVRRGGGAVGGAMAGCLNSGYAVVCYAGRIRVWNALSGEYLYRLQERVDGDGGRVVAASDRYIIAWSWASGLQLWDFGVL